MLPAIILVSPKSPGNVGSAARAMLNMGASDLRLVAPRCDHLSGEARALAVHAGAVLEGARVYPTLDAALAGCDYAVGTSARARGDLPPPRLPAQVRPEVRAAAAPALVFGPEESGLSSDDLERCQATVRLPTAEYASLNLAQAVLLVCYEFLQASDEVTPVERKVAPRDEQEALLGHLREIMLLVGYTDEVRARHALRLWRPMLDRAALSAAEIRMFRGFLRQVRWKVAPYKSGELKQAWQPEGADADQSSGESAGPE